MIAGDIPFPDALLTALQREAQQIFLLAQRRDIGIGPHQPLRAPVVVAIGQLAARQKAHVAAAHQTYPLFDFVMLGGAAQVRLERGAHGLDIVGVGAVEEHLAGHARLARGVLGATHPVARFAESIVVGLPFPQADLTTGKRDT